MNFDDYEQLPTPSTFTNMIAGGAAGVLEHCVMYPMDSIKVIYFLLFSEKNCFFLKLNFFNSDQNAEPFANNIKSNTSQHTEIHDQIRGHFKVRNMNNNIHYNQHSFQGTKVSIDEQLRGKRIIRFQSNEYKKHTKNLIRGKLHALAPYVGKKERFIFKNFEL